MFRKAATRPKIVKDFRSILFILPLFAGLFWLATILGLLLVWIVTDNHVRYRVNEAEVTFISYVGAVHPALFITGSTITAILYVLSLLSERYLRHLRRIPGALAARDRRIDIAAVVFGSIGALALILLSIFNAFTHSVAHWTLTVIFVICIAISAICQTQEVRFLERNHSDRAHLRRSAIIKLVIVSLAIVGVIIFGVTLGICRSRAGVAPTAKCNTTRSISGVAEWFIATLYDAYLFSLVLDLYPAHKTGGSTFTPELIEEDRKNALHYHRDGITPGVPSNIVGREEAMNSSQATFVDRDMSSKNAVRV